MEEKIFTKIDLSKVYLQVKVDEQCTKYLMINMHKGLYSLKRLPFGLKVAPSLFQQIMDTVLACLDFTVSYFDDILIKSKKCDFCMDKIEYLGQIIDQKGRKPKPNRIEVIKNMPVPDNITKLQAFLGLVNYYNLYILKLYKLRAPLNELLRKKQNNGVG